MFVVSSLDLGRRGLDRWGLLCGLFLYFLYYWSDEKGEDRHFCGFVPSLANGAVAFVAAGVVHGRCRGGHSLASSLTSSSSGAASGNHL